MPTAEVRASEVSATTEVTTPGEMATATEVPTAAAEVLGISQTRRNRYRKSQQQRRGAPDDSCYYSVQVHHPVCGRTSQKALPGRGN
jgi:hypothetical protein